MVTTPQEVALLDVRKAIAMFQKLNVPILGIVENMSYFVAPDTGKRYAIFGEGGGQKLADEYGVPLLAQVPLDPATRLAGDEGTPITLRPPGLGSGADVPRAGRGRPAASGRARRAPAAAEDRLIADGPDAVPPLTLPIFPLPDVTFFPNTLLPLHVFEARYRAMVMDVLARDRRLAVVKLVPGFEATYAGKPDRASRGRRRRDRELGAARDRPLQHSRQG